MKNFLILNLLIGTVFILSTTTSCTKTKVQSESLTGNWVLKYSDSSNIHIEYPQDNSFSDPNGGGYANWASHLLLLKNDSAYWDNCGVDMTPQMSCPGVYTVSSDTANHLKITFDFHFKLGTWGQGIYSRYEYTLINSDILQLKNPAAIPTIYTYSRK
jgi:hypothetical protein